MPSKAIELAGQPVEPSCHRGLEPIGAVGREIGSQRYLDDRRARYLPGARRGIETAHQLGR